MLQSSIFLPKCFLYSNLYSSESNPVINNSPLKPVHRLTKRLKGKKRTSIEIPVNRCMTSWNGLQLFSKGLYKPFHNNRPQTHFGFPRPNITKFKPPLSDPLRLFHRCLLSRRGTWGWGLGSCRPGWPKNYGKWRWKTEPCECCSPATPEAKTIAGLNIPTGLLWKQEIWHEFHWRGSRPRSDVGCHGNCRVRLRASARALVLTCTPESRLSSPWMGLCKKSLCSPTADEALKISRRELFITWCFPSNYRCISALFALFSCHWKANSHFPSHRCKSQSKLVRKTK